MAKMTVAVMAASGNIGRILVSELLKKGHAVRALGRDAAKLSALKAAGAQVLAADPTDASALAGAFRGADAAFSLLPPGYAEDDFGAFQDKVGEAVAKAVRESKLPRLLSLSSIGAQHASGVGPVDGLHRHEARLNALAGVKVLHLRPCYFMQNLFWSIPTIKGMGLVASSIRPELPVWMVSTDDIGLKAADLLDRLDSVGAGVFEFVGPAQYTMPQAAELLGKAVGKSVKYAAVPYEDQRKAMLGAGMKPSITGLMIEMNRAFNDGRMVPTQPLGPERKGKTTLEAFSKVFGKVFQG